MSKIVPFYIYIYCLLNQLITTNKKKNIKYIYICIYIYIYIFDILLFICSDQLIEQAIVGSLSSVVVLLTEISW